MEGTMLHALYRKMYLMRRFEEEAARAYTEKKIAGFLHLYIGQEAVGAGAIAACDEKDYIITAYRCHAHYLARGGSPRAGMAELFGKESGCAKGRGGSMHFYDVERRFMGGWGIVGAHVPLATGFAFASRYRHDESVALCFLGEGAVNIGPFHEALCLASLWELPVVFIIENNGYAMGTPAHRAMVTEDPSIRALGYPMARMTAEGVDVVDVYDITKSAVDRARKDLLPMLLEFKTYRYRGHSMADPAKYRTKEELERWKARDPLTIAEQRMERDFPALAPELPRIRQEVESEVEEAVRFAEESAEPNPQGAADYTYIESGARG
jgi:pyruvate dehydrogenase E1 component alpha subunit